MQRMIHCLALGALLPAAIVGYGALNPTSQTIAAPPSGRFVEGVRSSARCPLMGGEWLAMETQAAIPATGQVHHCTVFYASDGLEALGGNNEDWRNPLTKVWFLPAEKGKHGRMYVGFDNYYPQGGVNDQGLFFDATATGSKEVVLSKDRPVYGGILLAKMMEECATVQEALDLFGRYNLRFMEGAQFLVGDRTGDAAVIEGDVILRKAGRYQVLTNFRQSEYGDGPYPCPRFNTAARMLNQADEVSLDLFRSILDATSQEPPYPTQYSCIYDLKRGVVYLYYYHNFEHVVTMRLAEELRKGERFLDLPGLFPPTEAARRFAEPAIERFEARLAERATADVDLQAYGAYVGVYEAEGASVSVTCEPERLYLQAEGQPRLDLCPRGEGRFDHPFFDQDLQATFVAHEGGEVAGLTIRVYGMEFRLRRVDAGSRVPWWVWLGPVLLAVAALAVGGAWLRRHRASSACCAVDRAEIS